MMGGYSVDKLFPELQREVNERAYIRYMAVQEHSRLVIKVRLVITDDLFVQIYRNDRFGTTNLALIYGGRRLYGRDQLNQSWHRHTVDAPQRHDRSEEGQRAVSLGEFLDEVEVVLADRNLP